MSTDKSAERLSALMDSEHTELEMRQLLKELDQEAAERWSRWHLVQDVLKGHDCQPSVGSDFSARVSAAVAAEKTPTRTTAWPSSLSRIAVAASVALAVVAGWQVWQYNGSGTAASIASAPGLPQVAVPVSTGFRNLSPMRLPLELRHQVQPVAETFNITRYPGVEQLQRQRAERLQERRQQQPYVLLLER